jgi:hypothetical protein
MRIPDLIEKYGKNTLLCHLPESEVDDSGSVLADAFRIIGCIETPRWTIDRIGMWDSEMWKVQAFLESYAEDADTSEAAQEGPQEGQ